MPQIKSYTGDKSKSAAGPQKVIRHTDQSDTVLEPGPSQKLYNHSPDGFQWGYGGSGPAQLALAILYDFTGEATLSLRLHQDFKRDKIAALGDTFILTEDEIFHWITANECIS